MGGQGQTVTVLDSQVTDAVTLLPSSMIVADQRPDEFGPWLFRCAVQEHSNKGMVLKTSISCSDLGTCWDDMPSSPSSRTYFIAAEEVEWDYLPGGASECRDELSTGLEDSGLIRIEGKSIGSRFKKARFVRYVYALNRLCESAWHCCID